MGESLTKHSNIQTFKRSNIQTIKRPNFQTFKHSNIHTSKRLSAKTKDLTRWQFIQRHKTLGIELICLAAQQLNVQWLGDLQVYMMTVPNRDSMMPPLRFGYNVFWVDFRSIWVRCGVDLGSIWNRFTIDWGFKTNLFQLWPRDP